MINLKGQLLSTERESEQKIFDLKIYLEILEKKNLNLEKEATFLKDECKKLHEENTKNKQENDRVFEILLKERERKNLQLINKVCSLSLKNNLKEKTFELKNFLEVSKNRDSTLEKESIFLKGKCKKLHDENTTHAKEKLDLKIKIAEKVMNLESSEYTTLSSLFRPMEKKL